MRRLAGCATLGLPDPTTCRGRLYPLLNASGTKSNVALSVATTGPVSDDAPNAPISSLPPGGRLTMQSNGSNWLAISR